MYSKVVGGGVLVVGDLHISDRANVGRHKNYLESCFSVLADIRNKVEEQKPKALVILGDLVGTVEKNIKHREVLSVFCKFFMEVGVYCKVYCVRGNHDFGEYPEFQFLSDLRLFETSQTCGGFFDFYGYEGQAEPEARFHLVDYGREKESLNLASGDTTNVVLAHNNFTIPGKTNWYNEHDGIELSKLDNFKGVYMVISGHIHTPSPAMVSTDLYSGGVCHLFYVGCPTRPSYEKNCYKSCWYTFFEYKEEEKSTDFSIIEYELPALEDTFYIDDTFIEDMTEEQIADVERKEALKNVLDEIISCRICNTDPIQQVQNIPYATDKAKSIACAYLDKAMLMKDSRS